MTRIPFSYSPTLSSHRLDRDVFWHRPEPEALTLAAGHGSDLFSAVGNGPKLNPLPSLRKAGSPIARPHPTMTPKGTIVDVSPEILQQEMAVAADELKLQLQAFALDFPALISKLLRLFKNSDFKADLTFKAVHVPLGWIPDFYTEEGARISLNLQGRNGIRTIPKPIKMRGFEFGRAINGSWGSLRFPPLMEVNEVRVKNGKLDIRLAPDWLELPPDFIFSKEDLDLTTPIFESPLGVLFPNGEIEPVSDENILKLILQILPPPVPPSVSNPVPNTESAPSSSMPPASLPVKKEEDPLAAKFKSAILEGLNKLELKGEVYPLGAGPVIGLRNPNARFHFKIDLQKILKAPNGNKLSMVDALEQGEFFWPDFPLNQLPLPPGLKLEQAKGDLHFFVDPLTQGITFKLEQVRGRLRLSRSMPIPEVEISGGFTLHLNPHTGQIDVDLHHLFLEAPSLQLQGVSIARFQTSVSGRAQLELTDQGVTFLGADAALENMQISTRQDIKLRIPGQKDLYGGNVEGKLWGRYRKDHPLEGFWDLETRVRGEKKKEDAWELQTSTAGEINWPIPSASESSPTYEIRGGLHDLQYVESSSGKSSQNLSLTGSFFADYRPGDPVQPLLTQWNTTGSFSQKAPAQSVTLSSLDTHGFIRFRKEGERLMPVLRDMDISMGGSLQMVQNGKESIRDALQLTVSGLSSPSASTEEAQIRFKGPRMAFLQNLFPHLNGTIAYDRRQKHLVTDGLLALRDSSSARGLEAQVRFDTKDFDRSFFSLSTGGAQKIGLVTMKGALAVISEGSLKKGARLFEVIQVETREPIFVGQGKRNWVENATLDGQWDTNLFQPEKADESGLDMEGFFMGKIPAWARVEPGPKFRQVRGRFGATPGTLEKDGFQISKTDMEGEFTLSLADFSKPKLNMGGHLQAHVNGDGSFSFPFRFNYAINALWDRQRSRLQAGFSPEKPTRLVVGPLHVNGQPESLQATADFHGDLGLSLEKGLTSLVARNLGLRDGQVFLKAEDKDYPVITNLMVGADHLFHTEKKGWRCGGVRGSYVEGESHLNNPYLERFGFAGNISPSFHLFSDDPQELAAFFRQYLIKPKKVAERGKP